MLIKRGDAEIIKVLKEEEAPGDEKTRSILRGAKDSCKKIEKDGNKLESTTEESE